MNSQDEYNEELQSVLISFMISDTTSFSLSQNIINPAHFDDKLRPAVKFIMDYALTYRTVPKPEQIKATTGIPIEFVPDIMEQHSRWYLDTIEKFTRFKALEYAIMDGMELLQKGKGGEVEKLVKDALTISLMSDLGTSYFEDPLTRMQRLKDRSNYVSTGWKAIDKKLYGGFTKGSLNVFAGGSGSGKSLFLQNLGLNWSFAGMNVIYFTLELSEDLVSMRIDAMVSGYETKEILKKAEEISTQIAVIGKRKHAGDLRIKKLPEAGTNANDLRAYIKQYEIETGRKVDAVIVDYLDLMHPNNRAINPSDMFVKDKYVSEELRAIASDLDVPLATASQLNRSSVEAQEFDHSHIAGGISKINTADNVFGIFTSVTMRERGRYELQFLKTRSASCVGQKVELSYDPNCMRISDAELDQEKTPEELQEAIKARTNVKNVTSVPATTPPTSNVARKGLNDLLSAIHKGNDNS